MLFVRPHEKPYVAEIPDTLEAKQKAVGGNIEFVYNFDETVSVAGDFQIRFTNLSPTGQDANKDRICIWNVNWDAAN